MTLSVVSALGAFAHGFAPAAEDTAGAVEITVVARKFEFNPNVITVKQGDRVRLVITASDRDHGFKLEAFKVDQELKKGQPTSIEFTADKAGSFPFQCSDFCGLGHGKMKGKLVVEPTSNP
ncbi:MAG TPA: cupredoxin domain-containing protein [Terriglobia bacterium]|nr:cupredoxin domain-containing protein [Terriglobia bacterium]